MLPFLPSPRAEDDFFYNIFFCLFGFFLVEQTSYRKVGEGREAVHGSLLGQKLVVNFQDLFNLPIFIKGMLLSKNIFPNFIRLGPSFPGRDVQSCPASRAQILTF